MATPRSLPRLNPAIIRGGREGEDARLWKRVRSLETNLGYSNLALDDLPSGKNPGAGHILWHAEDSYGCHAGDYGSRRGGQPRKRRVPRAGPPAQCPCPPQKKVSGGDNIKSVPSLSPLPLHGQKLTPFMQPQEVFAQGTVAPRRNDPIDNLQPAPLKGGEQHKKIQTRPPGSVTVVAVARPSDGFCGNEGGPLPLCQEASQFPPSGTTTNYTDIEVGQQSPCSAQYPMFSSFVPGVSNASTSSDRSASTFDNCSRVQATTESSANAPSLLHREEEGCFNAHVDTRRTELSTVAADGINCANHYPPYNSSVGQQDFPHAGRRTLNNELMAMNEKAGSSKPRKKLRVRVLEAAQPRKKLRTIRAVYCRSLVSPNNPLTSNTVVARVKQGLQSGCEKRPKVLLVGSGTFNPVHKLHIRRFYLARNFLEAHKGVSRSVACTFLMPGCG